VKTFAGVGLVAAAALALICLGCDSKDIDCALRSAWDTECQYDLRVNLAHFDQYIGEEFHVRAESVTSGRSRGGSYGTLLSASRTILFDDFIRHGGGPYEVQVWVDLDGDDQCDAPPEDAIWREWVSENEESVNVGVYASDPLASECL
jgi:hypothetical protein